MKYFLVQSSFFPNSDICFEQDIDVGCEVQKLKNKYAPLFSNLSYH